jgi:hypothetical protein
MITVHERRGTMVTTEPEVALASNPGIQWQNFPQSPFFHRLHSGTGLLEVSDVLGISLLPTATVLTGISP